ncbi:MAG: hypothetical protein B7Z73_09920 [Planctomycetia bacterium 21-64-5]|nr:MAG: hypothetical protein B7Z73_09920 [Planctomycetia bacterium 21-64-5]
MLWLTFIGLVLVIVLVMVWHARRRSARIDYVVSATVSADGSTVAALLGDGRLLVWDSTGALKTTLATLPTHGKRLALALSADGRLAAVSREATVAGGAPRGGADLWDLAAGKLLRTIAPSAPVSRVVFSPTEAVLALQSDPPGYWQAPLGSATELHSLDDQGPPRMVGREGVCLAFSRDGKMLAVTTRRGEVEVYEAPSLTLMRRFPGDGRPSHPALAWGPEGKRLAVLHIDSGYEKAPKRTIEVWRITARGSQVPEARVENDAAAPTNWMETIHFLPNGRVLIVDDGSGLKAFDAKTLKPLPALPAVPALLCGVGFRGETFVTAGVDRVDLWNAATLDEPRPLLAPAVFSQPNVFPAVLGLMLCLVMLGVRRARDGARHCQNCQRPFYRIGKKDKSFHCPTCRADAQARTLAPTELARERRVQWRRGAGLGAVLFVAMLALATVVVFGNRFATWPLFLVGVAIVAAPTMLLRNLWLRLTYHITTLKHIFADPAADIVLAERAAYTPGTTRDLGPLLHAVGRHPGGRNQTHRAADCLRHRPHPAAAGGPCPFLSRTRGSGALLGRAGRDL